VRNLPALLTITVLVGLTTLGPVSAAQHIPGIVEVVAEGILPPHLPPTDSGDPATLTELWLA